LRKFLVVALAAMTLAGTASIAMAATTIQWTGQGSENLPCSAGGGHWVLTGKGITSATMVVNGVTYTMTQNGNGSWAADSDGRLGNNTTASATYEGSPRNPQFVLSHCNGGGGYGDPYSVS
jgi:hypothetical protein